MPLNCLLQTKQWSRRPRESLLRLALSQHQHCENLAYDIKAVHGYCPFGKVLLSIPVRDTSSLWSLEHDAVRHICLWRISLENFTLLLDVRTQFPTNLCILQRSEGFVVGSDSGSCGCVWVFQEARVLNSKPESSKGM